MNRVLLPLSLSVFSLVFILPLTLFAGSTGKIAGRVIDAETGQGIPFANVLIEGTTMGAATDVNGEYVILNVPPGVYTLVASIVGYQRMRVTDVRVSVDFTTPLDFRLKPGDIQLAAVEVRGESNPLIRQDLTNPVTSVTAQDIRELPVNEIAQVVGLQAGVTVGDDGSIHIRGGRSNEILYTLNGISVNDPYENTRAVGLATNAVQEVSVSTGTFSAEYGNALSGVVNYVTKEGGPRFTGSIRAYTGDYVSNHKDLFMNIEKVDPLNTSRLELTLGGPIPVFPRNRLSFYASSVVQRDLGYLYGVRLYNPTDSYLSRESFPASDPRAGSASAPWYFGPLVHPDTDLVGGPTGDGALVSLNPSTSYNVQGNVSFQITPTVKVKYEVVYDRAWWRDYLRAYTYNPDGAPKYYSTGLVHAIDFTHAVSEHLFYTLKGSLITDRFKINAFDAIDDPRYLPSFYQQSIPNTVFLTGGVSLRRFSRSTTTFAGKFDLVAQIGIHELKVGAELRAHKLDVEDYILQFVDATNPSRFITDFRDILVSHLQYKAIVPTDTGGYAQYVRKPIQWAAYVQDKMELLKSLIFNVGLRAEYFDPAAEYNPFLSQELTAGQSIFLVQNLKPAEKKIRFSPRVSVSYPITDRGAIRFSYGHFYQVPSLSYLYENPKFRAPSGVTPTFGNPDVNPEKSVQYEMGLQQALTEDLKMELTGYYKDVRDYIYSQQILTAKGDRSYYILTNLSYANTRGVSLHLEKRRSPGGILSGAVDYTFQVAEGNRTEPVDELFFDESRGKLPETYLVPLDFDRSHTLNWTVMLSKPDNWVISTIGYFRTGTPYTPAFPANVVPIRFDQNSGRQPIQWSVDLKLEKFFTFGGLHTSLFLQVENLFDRENELYVYANSGRALYSIDEVLNPAQFQDLRRRIQRGDVGLIPMSAVDNYYANPGNISRPRLVRVGITASF